MARSVAPRGCRGSARVLPLHEVSGLALGGLTVVKSRGVLRLLSPIMGGCQRRHYWSRPGLMREWKAWPKAPTRSGTSDGRARSTAPRLGLAPRLDLPPRGRPPPRPGWRRQVLGHHALITPRHGCRVEPSPP